MLVKIVVLCLFLIVLMTYLLAMNIKDTDDNDFTGYD